MYELLLVITRYRRCPRLGLKVLLYLGHTLLRQRKDDCWTDNWQATPSRQAVGIACRRPYETSPCMRVDRPASGEAAGSSRKQRAQSAWTDPFTIWSTAPHPVEEIFDKSAFTP